MELGIFHCIDFNSQGSTGLKRCLKSLKKVHIEANIVSPVLRWTRLVTEGDFTINCE